MDQNGPQSQRTRTLPLLLFARNFLKYPKLVGWVLPSSRFLVKGVLKQVDWRNARVLVEYGPGTGTFTREILARMAPDAILVAFEINPEFQKYLIESISDPRFLLVRQSATEVACVLKDLGYREADCVISGIPFKTLPHAVRDEIVRKTYSVLRENGKFLVYQLSTTVLPYLERVFGKVYRDFELRNLVPARLFFCAR